MMILVDDFGPEQSCDIVEEINRGHRDLDTGILSVVQARKINYSGLGCSYKLHGLTGESGHGTG